MYSRTKKKTEQSKNLAYCTLNCHKMICRIVDPHFWNQLILLEGDGKWEGVYNN